MYQPLGDCSEEWCLDLNCSGGLSISVGAQTTPGPARTSLWTASSSPSRWPRWSGPQITQPSRERERKSHIIKWLHMIYILILTNPENITILNKVLTFWEIFVVGNVWDSSLLFSISLKNSEFMANRWLVRWYLSGNDILLVIPGHGRKTGLVDPGDGKLHQVAVLLV